MNNQSWLSRSRQAVWHPCTQMKLHESLPIVPIARGEGIWLYDFEGKRYLDGVSSWWVNLFGHCNPVIGDALKQQLDTLEHVILAGFTQQPVIELSERLAALTGLGHAFYGSDGASATEIALKMSFHYWRNTGRAEKCEFVSLENSYHGETIGALSVTDVPLFRDTYAPLLRHSHRVPSPDPRLARPDETAEQYAARTLVSLETLLADHGQRIAALIVEPLVQCAAGMAIYPASWLKQAAALCEKYQVHLIADEIAVGFGRTGSMFAHQQAQIRPDFICLSKGITGGYLPLAAVLTTNKVYEAFYDDHIGRGFLHSHSYTGNALACRAALTVLDIFEHDQVLAVNESKTTRFNLLAAPLAQHSRVHNFRNIGMIWAFEVDSAGPGFSQRCFSAALARGLLLRPIGNTVYLMPPYVIDDAGFGLFVEVMLSLLDSAEFAPVASAEK
ncbi:adenosylmethionine--8-amino-7-oxononanoate transaminase [Parachitinimonas caeni]|uniref:Adenosylmethionine-8-amino-7-oxononanoate aminotransferase n=1 Tax=Parachitinimonas caeni TaxID=3031301 RepID=A0ABT7DT72_9NEIS|nr:adenosylmethionine--8-amino-7-oxononanoate transaminase [Parachitinimonas caeni]MDK2123236.1 adenosylmethionine--8-amino-7-oxononanoate transaminase [Parachitinimonas caeni]